MMCPRSLTGWFALAVLTFAASVSAQYNTKQPEPAEPAITKAEPNTKPTKQPSPSPLTPDDNIHDSEYILEVLVVLDQPTVDAWLLQDGVDSIDRVKEEINNLFYEANLLYDSFRAYGLNISIRLQDIHFAEGSIVDDSFFYETEDGLVSMTSTYALGAFEAYLGENDMVSVYDHAMYLASVPMDDGVTLGAAWTYGACSSNGTSVVQAGYYYTEAIIIAHELGHSLGSGHDDMRSDCNDDAFIMYPSAFEGSPYRWFFSPCSEEDISRGFSIFGEDMLCLNETTSEPLQSVRMGEMLTADQFCQRYFGTMVHPDLNEGEDLCLELSCWDGLDTIQPSSTPEGLPCGDEKNCFMGHCV